MSDYLSANQYYMVATELGQGLRHPPFNLMSIIPTAKAERRYFHNREYRLCVSQASFLKIGVSSNHRKINHLHLKPLLPTTFISFNVFLSFVGCVFYMLIFGGLMRSFGVFFLQFQQRFQANASEVAFMSFIQNIVVSVTGET